MKYFLKYKGRAKNMLISYTVRLVVTVYVITGLYTKISHAQEQPSLRTKAEQLFQKMEYANAAHIYERLVDTKKPRTADMISLADSYLYLKEYELASNWYVRIDGSGGLDEYGYWNYVQCLKQLGKYDEVKKVYEAYVVKYGSSPKLTRLIAGADSARYWMKNPTYHRLLNEQEINTEFSDFGIYPTDKGAIFVRVPFQAGEEKAKLKDPGYFRLYSAGRNENGHLSNSRILTENFNTSLYHIGPVIFDKKGEVLYVTRTYPGDDDQRYKLKGWLWKRKNLELKIYHKAGADWQEEEFPYNNVKEYSVGHAALSTDGKTLYFSSDMPGGMGGVDIWGCQKQEDGRWGTPQNLGKNINSDGDDMFPGIYDDMLYFSSDGHIGMGGLDIFYSKGQGVDWTKAVNVGYPLNSSADDFGFSIAEKNEDGQQGYLSSNRAFGLGMDDIYSFTYSLPKVKIILEALTKDKNTGATLPDSRVTLFSGKEIVFRGNTNDNGLISFEVDRGKEYYLLGEKNGYLQDSLSIASMTFSKDTLVQVALNLQPVYEKGVKFVLENIYYDFDKYNIRKDAAKILDKLVATLRDNPTLRIELSSHTDSRGSLAYNKKLSQNRAQAAVDYMVSRGIARDRMMAIGYGETQLVNNCRDGISCTVQQHQANRRTEVKILAY